MFMNYKQDDWADLLPLAEYAYNNSVSQGTKLSPFFVNDEYHPRTNWATAKEAVNPASESYVYYVKSVHDLALKGLEEVRKQMAKYKKGKEAPAYQIGDLVMLSGQNISIQRPSQKYSAKAHRPFKVVKVLSRSAVRLELPKRWKIHDVFHASLLEPYRLAKVSRKEPIDIGKVLDDAEEIVPSDKYLPQKVHNSACKRRKGKIEILY